VPEYIAFKIPDSISFEQAALIEPLSIALHAINNTPINLNDTAVVFGTGTIGLMIIKALKLSSCSRIIAVDIDDAKLATAKANGADICLNADEVDVVDEIKKQTDSLGADIAIEAVGVNSTISNAMDCLKKGGSLTMVGNVSPKIDFPLQTAVINELRIKGSYGCSNEYETSIDLLSAGKIDISDCISLTAPLSEGQQCFDRLHSGEKGLLKIVLIP
jgi:threonine dehydrogenase-like Zn-dependent dehydrogenase